MTYGTEDEVLAAVDGDDTDKRMQRALKIRKEIRALASDAIRRDNDECASAMKELHILNGVALLGLHGIKPYDFIACEFAAQPDDPPDEADVFTLLPVLDHQPGVREIDDVIGYCEKALASWRNEVPPAPVN